MTLDRYGRCALARLCRPALCAFTALALGATGAYAGYTLVDLGGPLGASAALSIGGDRTVAGYELIGPAMPHATVFRNGTLTDVGTLGGDASLAAGAASGGRVVGWARLPDSTRHAFLYDGGALRDLGTLGGHTSQAFGVNDAGTVVGSSWLAGDIEEVPMMWTEDGGMVRLPVPELHGGQAQCINSAGAIVGYVIDSVDARPFLYAHGKVTILPILGGFASKAFGISSNGIVVGYSITNDPDNPKFHAVYWRKGVIHDLGAMAGGHSSALAINNKAVAVGFSYDAGFNQIAVRFTSGGNTDLNSVLPPGSPWHLSVATGITENGVISGTGVLNDETRGFLLVPDGVTGAARGRTSPFVLRSWPQPMRGAGSIELTLDRAMTGPLRLYDVSGRRLGEIANGPFASGHTMLAIPPGLLSRLNPGVYYARIDGAEGGMTGRVVVIR